MDGTAFLIAPFLYFALAIPVGFAFAASVHGIVAIPRWIVEHAC